MFKSQKKNIVVSSHQNLCFSPFLFSLSIKLRKLGSTNRIIDDSKRIPTNSDDDYMTIQILMSKLYRRS